jgi:SAM-dependent methyltransferase
MNNIQSDEGRAEFYASYRDRSATNFKPKHITQYDHEFGTLTGADTSMSVLEIGCGTGLFLRYLKSQGYSDIVGVDMDVQLGDALADLDSCEIYLDDISNILSTKLSGRRFDRIVMLDVAEHLQMHVLTDLMKALSKHMKPNGRLLLRVPNVESPWGLKMFFGSFDHVTPLGPGRMWELGLLTGWSCDDVFPQEPRPFLRRLKERLINKLIGGMLSYHPDVWTANLLAVYSLQSSKNDVAESTHGT